VLNGACEKCFQRGDHSTKAQTELRQAGIKQTWESHWKPEDKEAIKHRSLGKGT